MTDQRDNVLFLGASGRSLDPIPLAAAGYNKPQQQHQNQQQHQQQSHHSAAASARSVHYATSLPFSAADQQLAHRLAPVTPMHHPLYHPAAPGAPYLYTARDYAADPFHAERFARNDLSEAQAVQQQQQQGTGASSAPRRRPSLLPAAPASDFPFQPYIQSAYAARYDSDRYPDYPLSGYERNKSLAAAQQQAAVAASVSSHSSHSRNVLPITASHVTQQQHYLGNRQLLAPVNSLPVSRTPQHIAHVSCDTDSDPIPKRPRLIVEQKPSLHQPLHIDIRDEMGKKQPAYTPQVEAISPTLPMDDLRQDMSPFKTTKDDLVQNMNRIDREISEVEIQISKLRDKRRELEAASKPGADGTEVPEPAVPETKQQSIAQLIYSDNRKKAHMTHSLLDRISGGSASSMNLTSLLPLYNQPSDTPSYHLNKERFKVLKPKLMAILRKQREHERAREQFLTQTYERLSAQWREKMETRDSNPARKTKDSKFRDFFEKQFPELRKQREDKERLSRAGQRIRSDADLEDIMEGLQEQEAEDKKMRSYAVIPPILQDKKLHPPVFINKNNLIRDPLAEYKERKHINIWSDAEKDTFREKFLLYPKNFGLISSYLERKSVRDCVHYYYASKKSENYKQLLRKHVKKRTRALVKQQQAAVAAAAAAAAAAPKSAANRDSESGASNIACLTEQRSLISSVADRRSLLMEEYKLSEKENEESNADTRLCHECFICKSRVESLSKSRPITKSNCHHFGIPAETLTGEPRACLDCRFKHIRKQCPIPSCKSPERKVKRLKSLPQKWFDMSSEERRLVADKLNLPFDAKKGCMRCVVRVARLLGVPTDLPSACHDVWDESEVNLFKKLLKDHGRNWAVISESLKTKTRKECKNFFYSNKLKFKAEMDSKATFDLTYDSDDYWNDLTDDSEETSSADEGNGRSTSDTASAPSPSAVAADVSGPLSASRPPERLIVQRQQRVPSFLINPNAPSTTNLNRNIVPAPAPTAVSVAVPGKQEPTCVRDLIFQAIEMSLQGPSKPPDKTITTAPVASLPVSYLDPNRARDQFAEQKADIRMSLSPTVAAADVRHPAHRTSPASLNRPEGLVMAYSLPMTQMNSNQRHTPVIDNEVQDLSKKNSSFREPIRSHTPQSMRKDRPITPSSYYPFQNMPPPAHSHALDMSQDGRRSAELLSEANRNLKPAHSGIMNRSVIPRPPPRTPTSSSRPLAPPPPLIAASPSPKPKDSRSPHAIGSITHGTPVTMTGAGPGAYGQHYDPLMRSHAMGMKDGIGSIILGTPVQYPDTKRKSDFRMSPYDTSHRQEQLYRRPSPNPPMPHSASPLPRPAYTVMPEVYMHLPKGERISVQSPSQFAVGRERMIESSHPMTNQLLIDYNTSKQIPQLSRRGSTNEGKESPHSVRRDSSSPLVPRHQSIYTPHTGAPPPHLLAPTPMFTSSSTDKSYLQVHDRSMTVPVLASPGSQARQNVIQSRSQKGTSVIQTAKTSSPRPEQRNNVPSPQSFARKSFQQMSYPNSAALDNFQTLVNAAAAQQSLVVPVSESSRRLVPPAHSYVKNESGARSPKSPVREQRTAENLEIRRPSSRPDWSESEAEKRMRKVYLPEDRKSEAMGGNPFPTSHAAFFPVLGQQQPLHMYREPYFRDHPESGRRGINEAVINPAVHLSKQQRAELENEASRIFSHSFQKDQPVATSPAASGQARIGNLIEAIIDRQINLPVDRKTVQQSPPEPSGQVEHPKPVTEDMLHANQRLLHPNRVHESHPSYSTLGDHISTFIHRSFNDRIDSRNPHVALRGDERRSHEGIANAAVIVNRPIGESTDSMSDAAGNSWKLRRALQQNEEERVPISRPDTSSRPSSRSSSVSSQHLILSANVEPISPPASAGGDDTSELPGDSKRSDHSSVVSVQSMRPASRPGSASHQSLDRTPPALEILEDNDTNNSAEESSRSTDKKQ